MTIRRPAPPGGPLRQPARQTLQVLQFGDQAWSIRRQEFSGQRADVPAALLAACRAAIKVARPHGDKADAAEQDVLRRLAAERPLAEEQGQWRLYQWSQRFPVMIGARAIGADVESRAATAGTNLAESPYRVVIWGVAVPMAANAWTLYVFPARRRAGSGEHDTMEVALPPGSRRLASIRTGRAKRSPPFPRAMTTAVRPGSFTTAGSPIAVGRPRSRGSRTTRAGTPALRHKGNTRP